MAEPDSSLTGPASAPLRSSEALVRGFFNAAPMMMGLIEVVGSDIRILSGNAATARFFGISPESLPGRLASTLDLPETVIMDWIGRCRESLRLGSRVRFGYELPRPDGPRWLTATVAPAQTPPNTPPRFLYIVEDVTEGRSIDEAARLLEEPPEAPAGPANVVVDDISDVFFAVDRDWNFTYANHQAEITFLRSWDEFIGRNVWEVFPRALGTRFETEGRRAMAEQVTVRFEEYAPSYDAWFEVHIYPNLDGLSVFMTNVTERKHVEEERDGLLQELEQIREDLNRAQAVTQTGSWRLDRQRGVYVWSDETYRIFGIAPGTPITDALFRSRVHPEDRELVDRKWSAALAGKGGDIEHRIVVGGAVKWVRARNELEFGPDGELLSGFGTIQDVTEIKQAEQALKESERRYRFLAEAIPQVVWTAEPNGLLDYFNGRLREITGLSPDAALGVQWHNIVHPEELPPMAAAWSRCVATGEPFEFEHRVRFADGSYCWFLTRALPFRDETGAIVKWFGSSTDIHERKEAEEAMAEADRAKDRFVAMLAHELRNPLHTAALAVRAMELMEVGDDREKPYAEIIARQIQAMTHLVNDLLDLARIKQGKVVLNLRRVSLSSIVEHAVETARPLIAEKRHHLDVRLPDGAIDILADSMRLVQVFGNLLNNAAKYTDPGGNISITADREGGRVVVRVKDTGIGIAPEMLSRVFDLFAQADTADERTRGGLGLGLTLVRQLLELHGGTVQAESDGPGTGSTFTVRLPLMESVTT